MIQLIEYERGVKPQFMRKHINGIESHGFLHELWLDKDHKEIHIWRKTQSDETAYLFSEDHNSLRLVSVKTLELQTRIE